MEGPIKLTEDIHVLPSFFPIPGFGGVPVNAFVLKARQPMLVDTGLHQDNGAFLDAVKSVIDPADLRWIWLTHPDQDHVGSLMDVLESAPNATLVTTFLGFGILSLSQEIPLDRVYLLNPGQQLDLGDRTITAVKPPTFDSPATTGFFDSKSRAFFSSDCFGALLDGPVDDARSLSEAELRERQILWTAIDSPWLHKVDQAKLATELKDIGAMDVDLLLSAHLPPAPGLLQASLASVAAVPDADPFVGPDQAALTAMLAQMTQGAPTPA